MIARNMISLAAIAAVLATATGPSVARTPIRPERQQAYCRTPAPLPVLGREQQRDPQQQETRRTRTGALRSSDAMASPVTMAPPPPPPPAMAPPSGPAPASDIVVTGSAISRTAGDAPVAVEAAAPASADGVSRTVSPGIPPRPQPYPQAGLLTAGEHDDLLNPRLYANYVAGSALAQQIPDLPRLDTERVLTVRAVDGNGRPVPFADIVITCSDGNRLTLATQADGTASFFPELDRLSPTMTIAARYAGSLGNRSNEQRVTLGSGAQSVDIPVNVRIAAPIRQLDLALVIDTTGSMGDEIRFLQTELTSIIGSLQQRHPRIDIRVGFVFYRDTGDDYVTRTVGFGHNLAQAQSSLQSQSAGGGGDYPEAMDQALIRAAALDWRPNAVKTLLLVADAPPHDQNFGTSWAAAETLRARRVHITPVAASGVADKAEYAMRAMAAVSQSRYLFLTDDSGVGNPHAPPAIDCYLVTRLDALLRRVIDSQLSGRRIEPREGEVIRSVGQYDAGRCVLPSDWQKQG
jgi:von Willebrand factor type A domain